MRLPGPAPAPRHSELRQPAPRALSRAVGWWRCRHGASRALTQTRRPQPRQIDATRGQRRCPKVLTGCRTAAGRPQSLRTRPCLAGRVTGSLARRRGATARVPYGGAAAASYAPGGQWAWHTCHRDPARPARSASTPRGPPRYSAGCRGYPALERAFMSKQEEKVNFWLRFGFFYLCNGRHITELLPAQTSGAAPLGA